MKTQARFLVYYTGQASSPKTIGLKDRATGKDIITHDLRNVATNAEAIQKFYNHRKTLEKVCNKLNLAESR